MTKLSIMCLPRYIQSNKSILTSSTDNRRDHRRRLEVKLHLISFQMKLEQPAVGERFSLMMVKMLLGFSPQRPTPSKPWQKFLKKMLRKRSVFSHSKAGVPQRKSDTLPSGRGHLKSTVHKLITVHGALELVTNSSPSETTNGLESPHLEDMVHAVSQVTTINTPPVI
jgi:hypothetical protein